MTSTSSQSLAEAQIARDDRLLLSEIDTTLDMLQLSAKTVGPEARYKLRNLLKYYAKKPRPFTACYRDNLKRFGPQRTAEVCATLKDIMEGTTKWRHGHQTANVSLSENPPEFDEEMFAIIAEHGAELVRIIGGASRA